MATTAFDTFSLGIARDGGTVVVRVTGELDVAQASGLRQALRDLIEEQGNLSIKLDLADMTFIDSTGLSVLLGALRRIEQRGGELVLANPRRSARRVFEIVGFTRVFTISEDQGPAGPS